MTNSVSPRSMRNAQKYSIISANNSCSTNYHRWSTKKKAWWQYYFSQLPPFKDRNPNAMEPNGMEGRVGYKWRAMSPPPLPPPPGNSPNPPRTPPSPPTNVANQESTPNRRSRRRPRIRRNLPWAHRASGRAGRGSIPMPAREGEEETNNRTPDLPAVEER